MKPEIPPGYKLIQELASSRDHSVLLLLAPEGDEQEWALCANTGQWLDRRVLRS